MSLSTILYFFEQNEKDIQDGTEKNKNPLQKRRGFCFTQRSGRDSNSSPSTLGMSGR